MEEDVHYEACNVYVAVVPERAVAQPQRISQYPWVSLLEKACVLGRRGRTNARRSGGAIEAKGERRLGLEYDTSGWGRSYYCTNTGYFLLGNFLRQTSSLVNCTDCAIIVTTFANALGCDLHEARMRILRRATSSNSRS